MFDGNKVSRLNIPKWLGVFRADLAHGAYGIIAVHDITLGTALGGCRMMAYPNEAEALTDALRLSRGMTFKNAIADLPLGGGKSVIVCDPKIAGEQRAEILADFGKFVSWVNSRRDVYLTAEDMNTTVNDLRTVSTETNHSCGLLIDPSPYTAWGVFCAIEHAVKYFADDLFDGSGDLKGKRVLVQGVGKVGMTLVGHLYNAGAKVLISDTYQPSIDKALATFPDIEVVPADDSYLDMDLDVFAPCARGEVLTKDNVQRPRFKILCGAANNQLQNSAVGNALQNRRIVYCPDYVANMGGVCSIQYVEFDKLTEQDGMDKLGETVRNSLDATFAKAMKDNLSFNNAVDEVVKEKVWGTPGEKGDIHNASLFPEANKQLG